MPFTEELSNLLVEPALDPPYGQLQRAWRAFGPHVVVASVDRGLDAAAIGALIRGALDGFVGLRVSLVVVDRAFVAETLDSGLSEAVVWEAKEALRRLDRAESERIQVLVTPLEGYCDDLDVSRGAAARMVIDELEDCQVQLLVWLDPQNLALPGWRMEAFCRAHHHSFFDAAGRPYLAVPVPACAPGDGALGRLVVGPLSGLLGCPVAWDGSLEMGWSHRMVNGQRLAPWTPARRHRGARCAP